MFEASYKVASIARPGRTSSTRKKGAASRGWRGYAGSPVVFRVGRRAAPGDGPVAAADGRGTMTLLLAALATSMLAASHGGVDPPRPWVSPERCPAQVQLHALGSVSSAPRDWRILHYHFLKFGQCDAGAVAEGYSHGVVTLLAHSWQTLGGLATVARNDPIFLKFVLAHIDATTAEEDLRQVQANVETACPPRHRDLCRRIGDEAKAALADGEPSRR
jgi:hypothetical protein